MKKYFIVIILAIITGSLLGYYTFRGTSAKAKGIKEAYLVQVGVYKNIENAQKKTKTIDNSIIIPEGDYYHVYTNIFISNDLIKKVSLYYDSINLHYYVKNIEIDEETADKIIEYEALLNNVEDIQVINKVSKDLLKIYANYRGYNEEL